MYNWLTLLYSRNYHDIVNQLYSNKKIFLMLILIHSQIELHISSLKM